MNIKEKIEQRRAERAAAAKQGESSAQVNPPEEEEKALEETAKEVSGVESEEVSEKPAKKTTRRRARPKVEVAESGPVEVKSSNLVPDQKPSSGIEFTDVLTFARNNGVKITIEIV